MCIPLQVRDLEAALRDARQQKDADVRRAEMAKEASELELMEAMARHEVTGGDAGKAFQSMQGGGWGANLELTTDLRSALSVSMFATRRPPRDCRASQEEMMELRMQLEEVTAAVLEAREEKEELESVAKNLGSQIRHFKEAMVSVRRWTNY